MNSRGFSLIELIIVLSLMGIISLIAVPRFLTVIEGAKRDACEAGMSELEHAYEIYLVQNDKSDTYVNFTVFLSQWNQKICPEDGIISRVDGEIQCSIHGDITEADDGADDSEDDGSVPFL